LCLFCVSFILFMYYFYCFFFFFSSRRRHTRCLSDWSSDVCSSDLRRAGRQRVVGTLQIENDGNVAGGHVGQVFQKPERKKRGERSEERRVGKECRAGGWTGE